tara:strand:- start:340 stop:654 length:315 start_codon:yes stop_codon:yes gene_type:complete
MVKTIGPRTLKKINDLMKEGRERSKKAHYEKRATIREDARNPLKKKSPTKPVARRSLKTIVKPKVKSKTIHSPHTTKRGWDIKEMERERRKSLKLHNQKLRGKR